MSHLTPIAPGPTLQGIIRGRVDPSTVINSDPKNPSFGWRGYNGLVDLGYGHFRVDHSHPKNLSLGRVHQAVHGSGSEGFWGLAKVRLAEFKGLPKHTFHLHLKETEWRYNQRHADKYEILLPYQGRTLRVRQNPLS